MGRNRCTYFTVQHYEMPKQKFNAGICRRNQKLRLAILSLGLRKMFCIQYILIISFVLPLFLQDILYFSLYILSFIFFHSCSRNKNKGKNQQNIERNIKTFKQMSNKTKISNKTKNVYKQKNKVHWFCFVLAKYSWTCILSRLNTYIQKTWEKIQKSNLGLLLV